MFGKRDYEKDYEGLQATCDKCDEVFNVEFRENKRPGGVIATSFKCTNCGHVYFVSATNKPIRKIHEKMDYTRQAIGKARREGDEETLERLLVEMSELEDESIRKMNELKDELGEA